MYLQGGNSAVFCIDMASARAFVEELLKKADVTIGGDKTARHHGARREIL